MMINMEYNDDEVNIMMINMEYNDEEVNIMMINDIKHGIVGVLFVVLNNISRYGVVDVFEPEDLMELRNIPKVKTFFITDLFLST